MMKSFIQSRQQAAQHKFDVSNAPEFDKPHLCPNKDSIENKPELFLCGKENLCWPATARSGTEKHINKNVNTGL
jgi:hypothetical protein